MTVVFLAHMPQSQFMFSDRCLFDFYYCIRFFSFILYFVYLLYVFEMARICINSFLDLQNNASFFIIHAFFFFATT